MAVTSLWRVNGRIKNVVEYAKNSEKTTYTPTSLEAVITYAMKQDKTKNESSDKIYLISGINCGADTAIEEMLIVKKRFSKEDGVIAYHGYQSFAEDEVTPILAHEIGVQLAQSVWGDRYQVVVTTHVDKQSHYHNHFVLNTVSFIDGIKYHRTKQDYLAMRKTSDELCRQYGLSVIKKPQHKGMHYSEWKAEKEGKPTWRSIIREDIDNALSSAFTFKQFVSNLKKQGYEVKTGGKYIAIKPKDKERYVRLRSLGYGYREEDIKDKILYGEKQSRYKRTPSFNPFGNKGLRALYYHYLYELGIFPKHDERKRRNAHFLYREELIKLDSLIEQYDFVTIHGIDTYSDLKSYKDNLFVEIGELKKELIGKSEDEKQPIYEQLKQRRKEVRLCDAVKQRSEELSDKLTKNEEDASTHEKEVIQKNKERNEEK